MPGKFRLSISEEQNTALQPYVKLPVLHGGLDLSEPLEGHAYTPIRKSTAGPDSDSQLSRATDMRIRKGDQRLFGKGFAACIALYNFSICCQDLMQRIAGSQNLTLQDRSNEHGIIIVLVRPADIRTWLNSYLPSYFVICLSSQTAATWNPNHKTSARNLQISRTSE